MLGHFIFNSISVLLIYFKVADLDSNTSLSVGYVLIGLASVIIVVFLINYLRKQSKTTYVTEFPPTINDNFFDEPEERA